MMTSNDNGGAGASLLRQLNLTVDQLRSAKSKWMQYKDNDVPKSPHESTWAKGNTCSDVLKRAKTQLNGFGY